MRFVTSIYTNVQLKQLSEYLDLALLQVPHLSLNYQNLDVDLALEYCNQNDITPILSLDRMYQPKDIHLAREFINAYKDKSCMFYVTDLGVAAYTTKLGLEQRVIFDPKTMITNSLDLAIYASYGFDACGISAEMTLSDAIEIQKKENLNVFYPIFGYRLMFYSKRHLISLYSEKNNTSYPLENVYFRESTRKDYFPGFENENGTAMYRSYVLNMLPELDSLTHMKYGFLDSYRIDDNVMKNVLKAYTGYIGNRISKEDAIKLFDSLNLKIEDGFKFKDSVYQKEELKL